jgi:hypothetical protein
MLLFATILHLAWTFLSNAIVLPLLSIDFLYQIPSKSVELFVRWNVQSKRKDDSSSAELYIPRYYCDAPDGVRLNAVQPVRISHTSTRTLYGDTAVLPEQQVLDSMFHTAMREPCVCVHSVALMKRWNRNIDYYKYLH